MSNEPDLEPLEPEEARLMYLDDRRHEVAEATLKSHGYRLNQFVAWCESVGIDNMNDLTGRDIHRFRVKRREEDGLATATMKGQLATLRMFLRFCASINAVKPGLDEKVILPTTTAEDARDEMLSAETAEKVLEHLEKFEYATLAHVLLETLWNTGLRVGAAVGLDIRDYTNSEDQYLELVHRPETGTPLKNGKNSERLVALSDDVCDVIDDWLDVNHPGVVDDHDRKPLFASRFNRLSKNRARSLTYEYTRPCVYSGHCPHDRDIDQCEAATTRKPFKCPSSLSTHPIRRGAITYHLAEDTPKPVASSRFDVSTKVLDRHYNETDMKTRMRQRRRYLPE